MAFGFQLVVVQSTMYRVVGEKGQVWDLPAPVGAVTVQSAADTLADDSEVTFRGLGFESEATAREAGETFRVWLQVASAKGAFGFDFGRDKRLSWDDPVVRGQFEHDGMYVIDDVHGLLVFEERGDRPLRLATRANPTVTHPSENLHRFLDEAASGPLIGSSAAVAADLISLSDHVVSATARFLTLVSAMEVLVDRGPREGQAAALVESFLEQLSDTRASATGSER